jgi:hypothetical protein
MQASEQIANLGGGSANPNLKLLANWAGGLVGSAMGTPEAGAQAGNILDKATPLIEQGLQAWRNR